MSYFIIRIPSQRFSPLDCEFQFRILNLQYTGVIFIFLCISESDVNLDRWSSGSVGGSFDGSYLRVGRVKRVISKLLDLPAVHDIVDHFGVIVVGLGSLYKLNKECFLCLKSRNNGLGCILDLIKVGIQLRAIPERSNDQYLLITNHYNESIVSNLPFTVSSDSDVSLSFQ